MSSPEKKLISPAQIPSAMTRKVRRRWKELRNFLRMAANFLPYAARHSKDLTLALLCSLGYIGMGLLEPWPLKLIFDNVLLDRPLPEWAAPTVESLTGGKIGLLYVLVVSVVVIALVRSVFYYYRGLLTAKVGQSTVADIRLDLFRHLQSLSFSFHDRRKTGDVLARLTSDIRILRNILVSLPLSVASELVLIAGMGVVMTLMDWRLALVSLAVVPGLALSINAYQRPMTKAIRKQREREGHLTTVAAEVLGAIKTVQGFTQEKQEAKKFSSVNKRSLRSGLKAARLEAKLNRAAQLVVATATSLVLLVAARRVMTGMLSPGDLLVFLAYLRSFYRPMRRISRKAERTARGTAAGERILSMLAKKSRIRDQRGAVRAKRFRGAIELDNVTLEYTQGQPVLHDISVKIEPGERVAFVGPSGAGKSSLVSLVPRFYDPVSGTVRIDGEDIKSYRLESVRKQMAIVFQEPVLFSTTIAENIAYGSPDASLDEIRRAAAEAGIDQVIEALPEGYETEIGERGGTLSGGQRQCVAIARAIIRDPSIVILDEPTTGLDTRNASMVMEALSNLTRSRTVLIISHQFAGVKDADRVVVIRDGRIVEEGDHDSLLAKGGLYHELQAHYLGEAAG